MKLRSFLYHPQIKTKHANKESALLTNHYTKGTHFNGPDHKVPLIGVSAKAPEAILHKPYLG